MKTKKYELLQVAVYAACIATFVITMMLAYNGVVPAYQ